MAVVNIEQLDKINEQLEGIRTSLDDLFENIQRQIDKTKTITQDEIDKSGEFVSEKLNTQLNLIRNKIIDIFHSQVEVIRTKIAPIEPIISMFPISVSLDTGCLTNIVDALTAIKDIIIAPYEPYIEFITVIVPKIITLSNNIQTLATYEPSLILPEGITPPTISVSVQPITEQDILG